MIKVRELIVDLKEGFLSIFIGNSKEENLFSINGKVPLRKAIPFGIQHVLAMFVANVTPLLIVFGAIGINNTEIRPIPFAENYFVLIYFFTNSMYNYNKNKIRITGGQLCRFIVPIKISQIIQSLWKVCRKFWHLWRIWNFTVFQMWNM